jgi:nucleoside-diphosphate-sugar epimerase
VPQQQQSTKPALVTGATGFVGSRLIYWLVRDGVPVRAIVRSAARARELLPAEVELVEADLTNGFDKGVTTGCDVVYHLATTHNAAGGDYSTHRAVHVDGTERLLEASSAAGIRRFVHCSTMAVHGPVGEEPGDESWPHRPEDPYQVSKSEGEQLVADYGKATGLPVTIARPTAIYGPGDRRLLKLFDMVNRGRFVMLGAGRIKYHMVYVDDLVRGLRRMAGRAGAVGEAFILGGAEYLSLRELVGLIAHTLGAPPPRLRAPVWPIELAGAVCEAVCKPFGISPPIYRRRVAFFTKSRAFSIRKAREVIGFDPRVDLRTGIARTARWYREHSMLAVALGVVAA